jgi:hypothetical protein
MRPTITHQIKPNIVSFLYAASWNDVSRGVGAEVHKASAAHPRPVRGNLHSLSCNRPDLFLDLLISGAAKL